MHITAHHVGHQGAHQGWAAKHRYAVSAISAVVALLLLRLALPGVIKNYVNDELNSLAAYQGQVDDIDLALWRGAYRIDGMRIVKRVAGQVADETARESTGQPVFFSSDRIDVSIEWRSLLRGSIVGEGKFIHPTLNLVQAENKQQSQLGKEVNWARQLGTLFPFRFNTVAIEDGTVSFKAPGIQSNDALVAQRLNGSISNLTNVTDKSAAVFADFEVTAQVLKTGAARIDGSINPLTASPTFDVNLTVEKVRLPEVNPWLRQYLKADAASGDFELYLEVAAADGRFKGYAKPLMHNVDLHGSEDDKKPALRKLWEGLVDFAAKIFENQAKDQVAARIPFTGSVEDPKAGILQAMVSVLHNAFIGAFANSLEGSISLRDVKKDLKQYAGDDQAVKQKD